jgi:hypothetical protein
MSYSRRQLEAFGEPLGESVTRIKPGGHGRIYGGGGGSPAPTTTTVNQSNIPEYLRPQVETVLGGAMQELFTTRPGGEGRLDITGTKPFVPYSTDPSKYVAAFTPLQQQAQQGAANLQTPGQFGMGTQLAGAGGLGGLGTAANALGFAGQQAGVGSMYGNMATNPAAYQAFMSPYQQAVTDVQMEAARRQADITRTQRQGQATRAGAFGGSRQAIEEAEAQRALGSQLQNIQATGLQNAFQQAQQNIDRRAQLELQGLTGAQQGLGAAQSGFGLAGQLGGTLGQLGTQQLGAQQGILGQQQQFGGQQQAQEQAIINQAIQNYAQSREAPMQALNQFNALLRGYALPGTTTTQYQAAPALTSQLAGLGTAGIGLAGLANTAGVGKKAGGTIRSGDGIDTLALNRALAGA